MAGLFGLFDYSKPGKGVRKDEPQKSRFVHFWELFARKFWKLCQLNLLYVLFCLPVATIGPATAAMTYVLRNLANEQPVFLLSDFWDAFKANWKQSFVYTLLLTILGLGAGISIQFYIFNTANYGWMFVAAALTMFICFMLLLNSYYAFLMIVTLDLPLRSILKNAVILSIVCLKTNLLTFFFTSLLLLATFVTLPFSLLLIFALIPAWIGFIICYNSYPGIKKYVIDPFVQTQPQEEGPTEGNLFRDEAPKED